MTDSLREEPDSTRRAHSPTPLVKHPMKRLTAVAVTGLLFVASCDQQPRREFVLNIESADPDVVARTDAVLRERFEMYNSATFTRISAQVEGSRISYSFPGDTPSNDTITLLYETTGQLAMILVDQPETLPIITNEHFKDVFSTQNDSGDDIVSINLTDAGGQRMLNTTLDNIGERMAFKIDDTVLLEATIHGAFAKSFQISGAGGYDVGLLSAVVYFGPLPAKVALVSGPPMETR